MALPAVVRSSFRSLLRTIHAVFAADAQAVVTMSAEARTAFRRNAGERDPGVIAHHVAEAEDAAEFLRQNIVQARLNDAGRYEMKLGCQHGDGPGVGAGGSGVQASDAAAVAAAAAGGAAGGAGGGCCGGGCR